MNKITRLENHYNYHYQCMICGQIIRKDPIERKTKFMRFCPTCQRITRCIVHFEPHLKPVA